jgi:uncharacterized membrane protein
MQPFRRFAAIALVACLAEILVVLFAKKPLPLAGIVAALVPLFVVVLVVIPMMRASKNDSKG